MYDDSLPALGDPLPPKKAEKNGKCQPHEEILNDHSWPTLDPLPPKLRQMGNVNPMKTFSMMIAGQHWIPFQQRKRDLLGGSIYLKKDLKHPELLSVFL